MSVFFEHHILLWKHPGVQIGLKAMKGALKRMMAGMQIFVTEAKGPGQIAFSRDGAGHIVPIHLTKGQELHVREHQFLAATDNIDYTFERVQRRLQHALRRHRASSSTSSTATRATASCGCTAMGTCSRRSSAPGEQIDIEPGGWLYKDPGVKMETNVRSPPSGLFGGMNLILNRFTGPGRIGIQSMYMHFATTE